VFAGFHFYDGDLVLNEFQPFEENNYYENYCFAPDNVDTNGNLDTGVFCSDGSDYYTDFEDGQPTTYGFDTYAFVTGSSISTNAVLSSTVAQWTYFYGSKFNTNYFIPQVNDVYGLPLVSVKWPGYSTPPTFPTLTPGSSGANVSGDWFFQYDQPTLVSNSYYFARPHIDPLPGEDDSGFTFNVTNITPSFLFASVGQPFSITACAKQTLQNGYSGVSAYAEQYFDSAYLTGNSGNITTNQTGILSEYGEFFPTQPGGVVLTTKPDGALGTVGQCKLDIIALNVDANHDGTMDFTYNGSDFVSSNNPYRFWVNDDVDSGDDSGNGIPGQPPQAADGSCVIVHQTDVPVPVPQFTTAIVDAYGVHGRRDLVDYFPVYVNISSLFQSNALSAGINPNNASYQYALSQADGVLRFVYTDLTPTNYMNFLRDTNESGKLDAAEAFPILPQGTCLDQSFIENIATNNGGIILVEAAANTTQPLVLTIYDGTNQIAQTSLYLSISGVEQMFRSKTILLNAENGTNADRVTDAAVPNEPPTNDKNFIFVHGYNVNPTQARGWDSDVFKRLYWSGSHAKFYGVTWEAADSQVFGSVTINLQTNIVNAFNTAPLLNNFLNSLSGTNIVAAHSLGNMLVLSTLNDCTNRNINTYFMVDAAVALDAIDTTAESNPDMYPSAWTNYNSNLWASDWYGLFPADDYRSTLTWWGRLTNFQNAAVYNFYSSGEEVLRDYPTDPPDYLIGIAAGQLVSLGEGDTGLYTWAWQEKLKGLMPANFLLSSDHGGWQFNEAYETNITVGGSSYWEPMSPAAAAELTTTQLQTNAFFNLASGGLFSFNNDLTLETSSGSNYAQANRNRILSDTIPCLTLPVGANPVPRLAPQNGDDENYDEQADFENSWPADRYTATLYGAAAAGEWHHSDIRAVAYTFTYKLFNQMVTLGNLR
jgi:Alpha/beta hydrolase of unknown function (DUF900)